MKLNSTNEFVEGKHNIGYVSSDFKERFGDTDFESRSTPTFQKLPRNMNDATIESELKPGLCELGDVLTFLDNAPMECKDGFSNLFYTPSFVVYVLWHGSGWYVFAWDRGSSLWSSGRRVFSPATGPQTLTPKPSDSSTLSPFEIEVIKQLMRIADALEETNRPILINEPRKTIKKKK